MVKKIEGIRSVDFKIVAAGHGVINKNGPTTLMGDSGTTVDNHTLPKLRGFNPNTGRVKEDTGYKYKKMATDIDFAETPMYVSQNCVRSHIFKDYAYDLHYTDSKNISEVLASLLGLVRGYVVPASQFKRTSPLLLEDFVEQLGNGNFEQFSRAGSKEKGKDDKGKDVASNSFFSATTFGDTEYISYGSINIENLEFISLDKKFDRAAMVVKEGEGPEIAQKVQDFIKSLDPSRDPKVVFNENYVRINSIHQEGEVGLLLDEVAIDIVINQTLEMIRNLSVLQCKGYMYVESLTVDYNDSPKMMRIRRAQDEICEKKSTNYAVYYEVK